MSVPRCPRAKFVSSSWIGADKGGVWRHGNSDHVQGMGLNSATPTSEKQHAMFKSYELATECLVRSIYDMELDLLALCYNLSQKHSFISNRHEADRC